MRMRITIVAILILLSFGTVGCVDKTDTVTSTDIGWTIMKSPVTGRYYEVISMYPNTRVGMMAMSEVTQEEYEVYILGEGK